MNAERNDICKLRILRVFITLTIGVGNGDLNVRARDTQGEVIKVGGLRDDGQALGVLSRGEGYQGHNRQHHPSSTRS